MGNLDVDVVEEVINDVVVIVGLVFWWDDYGINIVFIKG